LWPTAGHGGRTFAAPKVPYTALVTSAGRTKRVARKLTDAENAVLGLLTYGEASGYELSRWAEHNVNLLLSPTKSRIYHVLPRLFRDGYVTRREVEQERRPDKQLYRLTDAGRAALVAWLNDTSTVPHRERLLLKLFFASHADPNMLLEQVRAFRQAKEGDFALLTSYGERNLDHREGFFRNLTIDYGLDLTRLSIRWSTRTIKALEEHIRDAEKVAAGLTRSPRARSGSRQIRR
jgi:DNA-binding PadR family transcriptional regulator